MHVRDYHYLRLGVQLLLAHLLFWLIRLKQASKAAVMRILYWKTAVWQGGGFSVVTSPNHSMVFYTWRQLVETPVPAENDSVRSTIYERPDVSSLQGGCSVGGEPFHIKASLENQTEQRVSWNQVRRPDLEKLSPEVVRSREEEVAECLG